MRRVWLLIGTLAMTLGPSPVAQAAEPGPRSASPRIEHHRDRCWHDDDCRRYRCGRDGCWRYRCDDDDCWRYRCDEDDRRWWYRCDDDDCSWDC